MSDVIDEVIADLVGIVTAEAPDGWTHGLLCGSVSEGSSGFWTAYAPTGFGRGDGVFDVLRKLSDALPDDEPVGFRLGVFPDGRFSFDASTELEFESDGVLFVRDAQRRPVFARDPGTGREPTGDPARAVRLLREIAAVHERVLPGEGPLRPPATEAEIARAEVTLGVRLPPDVRALYLEADGEQGIAGVLNGWGWSSLASVVGEAEPIAEPPWFGWTLRWNQVVQDAYPHGHVRRLRGNRRWIPIASDGSGNCYAVDLDPAPLGVFGQVIAVGPDYSDGPVRIAESVTELLARTATLLRDGHFELDEEWLRLTPPETANGTGRWLPDAWHTWLDNLVSGVHSDEQYRRVTSVTFRGDGESTTVPALDRLPNVQALRVFDAGELTLHPLPALREFVAFTGSVDLRVLRDLPVESVLLRDMRTDLSVLAGHPTLRALDLSGVTVDLALLRELPAISGISVPDAEVTGLDVLTELDMDYLALSGEQWESLMDKPPLCAAAVYAGQPTRAELDRWLEALGATEDVWTLRRDG